MSDKPLGAQIPQMLKSRGVDVVFGIPGVHNQELYRGIEQAGLSHVLARHEQGAGFMADGYARATDKPGVAFVITGPGLTNIMTPMGQAWSDSVPMLVLSSCLDESAARHGQLHQMRDQRAAAATVCDWSEEARTSQAAYRLIDRAFLEFMTGRARPKHIQIPISVLEEVAPAPVPNLWFESPSDVLSAPLDVDEVLTARRPLFIFGGGARWASEAARTVLDRLEAACFTTYAGRGIVAPNYPLNFGSYLARPDSAEVIASADLVIAIGTELSETDLWRDALGHDARLIRVDIDPDNLGHPQKNQHNVLREAGSFLWSLLDALPEARNSDWTASEVASARRRWHAEVDAERPGITPVCTALAAALPQGTMIYSDMTQFAYVAKEVWDMDRPGHWHHPTGFGTLGYALPAAIGGAVARPGLPTMAIAGDYGFQYTLQELGTAVELGLPLPVILWDNGKLAEIEDSMVRAQIAPNAVIQKNPDFLKLAEAYGAHAAEPSSLAEMQDAVRGAFAADAPTLIRVTPGIAA